MRRTNSASGGIALRFFGWQDGSEPLAHGGGARDALLGGLLCLFCLLPARAEVQRRSHWTLDDILHQLDRQAGQFESLVAKIERTKVTAVVNDRSTESGQIYVRRDARMLIEITHPAARTVLRRGDQLFVFHPRTNRVDEYDLSKHRALVDQFLLLGFGTSGSDLKKGYLITLLDEQTLEGKRVVWLELTPKAEAIRNQIAKIHLWIDQATWLPVQQKFFETGSGDYFEIRYSDVVRNARIPDTQFRPRWPRNATCIPH
jgi:outer membrane lipoprotein-sorting protein